MMPDTIEMFAEEVMPAFRALTGLHIATSAFKLLVATTYLPDIVTGCGEF
jgi:hypothetical protein